MNYELRPTKFLPILVIFCLLFLLIPVYMAISMFALPAVILLVKPIRVLISQPMTLAVNEKLEISITEKTTSIANILDNNYSDNSIIIINISDKLLSFGNGFLKINNGELVIDKYYCTGASQLEENLRKLPIRWRNFSLRQIPHYLW